MNLSSSCCVNYSSSGLFKMSNKRRYISIEEDVVMEDGAAAAASADVNQTDSRMETAEEGEVESSSFQECLEELRDYLSSTGTRQGWKRKVLYTEEEEYLSRLFRQVVLGDPETSQRCSTSLIIYGPPGSGKSCIVESVLANLESIEEGDKFKSSHVVIRLSASLCTDFRSSVEEIAYQLRRFLRTSSGTSESLQSLEKLLEESEAATSNDDVLEQTLTLLRASFAESNAALIILLDKIDAFADHPNQRLLYNLFDMTAHASSSNHQPGSDSKKRNSSSNSFSLCVVGLTCRLDVLELFEKRVKSRFSHRQLNLSSSVIGNFDNFKQLAQTRLSSCQTSKRAADWNSRIPELFSTVEVIRILRSLHESDSSPRTLSIFLYSVCCRADPTIGLTTQNFIDSWNAESSSSRLKVAVDLPIPELIALLGIYKCIHGRGGGAIAWTPTAAARQVISILSNYGLSRQDIFKCIERLETLELVVRVTGRSGGLSETYFKSELLPSDFSKLWKTHPHVPSSFSSLI